MSDTPRTNELVRSLQGTLQVDMIVPLCDHARQLERELAEANAYWNPKQAQEEINALKAELSSQKARAERAEGELADRGFRRCDIPACNCHGWHGGHAAARLQEIGDALVAADIDLNGKTILGGVTEIIGKVASLERRLAQGVVVPIAELQRIVTALDRLYAHDEASRAAVLQYYGPLHSPLVLGALDASRLAQQEQEEKA